MNDKTDVELHLLDKDTSKQPKSYLDQTNKSPFIDFVDLNPSPTKYRPVTSILSYIFFADTFPLAKYVNNKKGDIENKELPLPYHDYNIERKVHLMDQGWFAEKDPQKRSIIKALFKGFKTEIFISIVLLLLTCTGHLVTTMLLGSIINMITEYNLGSDLQFDEIMPMAVWFAVLYFLTQALETWIGHFDFIIGAEMRLAITGLIYKKFQSVSLNSLQEANVGKIMNVITNDLSEFDYGYGFVFPTLFSPYNILIACYVMWSYFQAYTIISVVCLAFFLFFAIYLSNRSEAPRKEKNAMTDKRVQLTNELIDSIRLIKQYAWEEYFEKAIQTFRLREVVALLKLGNIEANGRTITESSVYLCTLITCITYVSFGGILDPEKVYATMMILNFLRYWAILFFHDGRMFLVNLRVMTPRIHDVLNLKDVLSIEETTKNFREYQAPEAGKEPIQFKNFTGYASSNAQKPCLRDLNLTIEPKKLTAVIGKIGSGKTSLLNAFLKEIPRTTGKLTYRGSLAYVEQEPIIFSGTLKENILFGKSYDHELYRKVLRACNWDQDFKQLPYKDATVIGQRGVTLSGGQKARLSLARALYSESDIYLLDDPLSAVDSQVARHVFKHAIKGILKDKTVILVTHHLTYAREADRVVVLNEGQVEAQGTFGELQNLNIGLMELFKEENVVEKVEKIEEKNPVQVEESILSRKSSIMSDRKMSRFNEEEILEPQGQETKEESIMVTWQTYKSYLRASGKWGFMWTIFGLYLLCQLFIFGFTRFLGYWADIQNEAALLGDEENFSNTPYIWGCIALCCGIMLTYNLKISYTIKFLTETNSNLHKKMLWSLIRAVVPFFDKVAAGQILNRFSGDIGILDKQNWLIVFDLIDGVIYAGFFIGYLCVVSYTMIFPSIIVVFILFKVRNYFQRPSIELKRVDLISRSPVYSELTSTLNGLLIIRIYNQGGRHIKKFLDLIYDNSRAFLYNARTTRSFMVTLKIFLYILTISGIFIFIGVAYYGDLESGVFGLTLLYLLEIANKSVWIIRQTLFLDINMQSAQRLLEYCNLPEEPPQHTSRDSTVQTSSDGKWPNKGELQFNNVVLRYNSIDKPALRGITFAIPPKTKVGVVGRTGAGKSSIIQALFRMVEIDKQIDSSIKIDGVNIQELGLQFLRKNLAIIPQTPVLFIGTIKKNIDPFEEFSDYAIWEVLERINLKSLVEDLEKQLDTEIDSKSSLFSTGQKQLICLARAMLRRSKIVMLDEATANIDIETDRLIQQQLKEYFRECTVLTIAHRLNNIADYDKVLVIDQGVAVEYDEPYKLLVRRKGDQNITNQEGHFAKMVLSGGEVAAREIFNIAYRKSQSSK